MSSHNYLNFKWLYLCREIEDFQVDLGLGVHVESKENLVSKDVKVPLDPPDQLYGHALYSLLQLVLCSGHFTVGSTR